MFIEPNQDLHLNKKKRRGWIELICGAMFSGKTEELIRRLNRAVIAGQRVEIFKPALDKRYQKDKIVSHNQNMIRSSLVDFASDILLLVGDCEVVGIDEAQFFDEQIIQVANKLANQGKRVIITGLDKDFKAKPFGFMPQLMVQAEYITKLHAICVQCGALASYSYRLSDSEVQVMVGEKNLYEPRCRNCFYLGKKAEKLI
ncbi:MAG: thymidine kinase [Candidatus Cyclobacteriaceae bacterium M3_2C_046]